MNDLKEAPAIQSIENIFAQRNVATFKIQEPIKLRDHKINTAIIGTNKKDKLTGTSEEEILAGMNGRDILKGGEGPDSFFLESQGKFANKHADQIRDFDPSDGDVIVLDNDTFGIKKGSG